MQSVGEHVYAQYEQTYQVNKAEGQDPVLATKETGEGGKLGKQHIAASRSFCTH